MLEMKGIAIILAACLLFVSTENLWASFQLPEEGSPVECCSDCGSDCCSTEENQQDSKAPCEEDQQCPPGCDCSCQYQITALNYSFMELSGSVVQSYHYGPYTNSYSFEYSDDFLQPPRFG